MLKGSVRHVASFIAGHWIQLLQLSVVPLLILAAVNFAAILAMQDAFATLLTLDPLNPPGSEFMQSMMWVQSYSLLASVVSGLASTWLFVRIVRYYALGELSWASLGPGGAKPILLTFLYGLGILLLTLVAYLVALLALVIPVAILAAVAGENSAILAAMLGTVGAVAIILFLLWFFCRFAVGLPAVALGSSPDFFKDLWPLVKGQSWGLPLRMLGVYAVFAVVLVPVYFLVFWSYFDLEMLERVDAGLVPPLEFVESLSGAMMVLVVIGVIIQIPLLWFLSLLFAEAYRRFSGK